MKRNIIIYIAYHNVWPDRNIVKIIRGDYYNKAMLAPKTYYGVKQHRIEQLISVYQSMWPWTVVHDITKDYALVKEQQA